MSGLFLDEGIASAQHVELSKLGSDYLMDCSAEAIVITYCACPNDASAVKAALSLHKRGRKAHVLNGGIAGWVQAGLPLDAVKPPSQSHA